MRLSILIPLALCIGLLSASDADLPERARMALKAFSEAGERIDRDAASRKAVERARAIAIMRQVQKDETAADRLESAYAAKRIADLLQREQDDLPVELRPAAGIAGAPGSPTTPGGTADPVPAEAPAPVLEPIPDQMAAFDRQLRNRAMALARPGRPLRFAMATYRQEMGIEAIGPDGEVSLRGGQWGEMRLPWSKFTLADKEALAAAIARTGTRPDCAVAGFWAKANGNAKVAEDWLAKAGAEAGAVLKAFRMADPGTAQARPVVVKRR